MTSKNSRVMSWILTFLLCFSSLNINITAEEEIIPEQEEETIETVSEENETSQEEITEITPVPDSIEEEFEKTGISEEQESTEEETVEEIFKETPENPVIDEEEDSSVYEVTADGYEYSVNSNNTVTITKYKGTELDIVIPSQIEGMPVTVIGNYAFAGLTKIKSVVIPEGIISLGYDAFGNCLNLQNVIINGSFSYVQPLTFFNCRSLISIDLPYGVTSIGEEAFSDCESLVSITIPETVTSIGDHAFIRCKSLASELDLSNVTSIGQYAFEDCEKLAAVILGERQSYINYYAFHNCKSLKTIRIPENVTGMNHGAFFGCSGLTSIYVPAGCSPVYFEGCSSIKTVGPVGSGSDFEYGWTTEIPSAAFKGLTGAERIEIADTITKIGSGAFKYCTSLQDITMPDSVLSVGEDAFSNCSSLKTAHLSSQITVLEDGLFSACTDLQRVDIPGSLESLDESVFESCENLTEISLPDSVLTIGTEVFKDCKKLETVDLGNGIQIITQECFSGCSNLKTISYSDTLTRIDAGAFNECASLPGFSIPDTVTVVGSAAFMNCISLSSVDIGDSVEEIGSNAFAGCISLGAINLKNTQSAGRCAFKGCKNLTDAVVHLYSVSEEMFSGCSKLKNLDLSAAKIEYSAFAGCSSLTEIVIPDVIRQIYGYAFSDCTGIKTVKLGNCITEIGAGAFYNCSNLTDLFLYKDPRITYTYQYQDINSSLTIRDSAFLQCDKLQNVYYSGTKDQWNSIVIEDNNSQLQNAKKHYKHRDTDYLLAEKPVVYRLTADQESHESYATIMGLIGIDKHEYLDESEEKTITVPALLAGYPVREISEGAFADYSYSFTEVILRDSIERIGELAFINCYYLRSMVIPINVETIEENTFYGCYRMSEISIPKKVKLIDESAFSGCSRLKDVYYEGSEEEWNEIVINKYNEELLNATIHYNSYHSHGSGKQEKTFTTSEYDYDLAVTCAEYSALAYEKYHQNNHSDDPRQNVFYEGSNNNDALSNRLRKDGYSRVYSYYVDDPLEDGATFEIGMKPVIYNNESRTLIMIVLHGTNKVEWQGDFNVTGFGDEYESGYTEHSSFMNGTTMLEQALSNDYGDCSNAIVIITGHSRGAAVGNLLARRMIEGHVPCADPSNVYAYLFAVPNCTKDPDESLQNIHNFCFTDDFVPNMPLSIPGWGFGRNGQTYTATAEKLAKTNADFRYKETLSSSKSDAREFSFDALKCINVLDYVGSPNRWDTLEKYYEKNHYYYYVPIINNFITETTSLYDFMHNELALAAMKAIKYEIVPWCAHPAYGPIANFFVDLMVQGPRYSVNDTHQMFTYYNALTTGCFNAGSTTIDLSSKTARRIAQTAYNIELDGEDSEQYSLFSADDSDEAIAEQAVLREFAENNSEKLGWEPDYISTWEGIYFNEDGRVDEIDIQNLGLSGTLDLTVFNELEILKIGGNHLTELILPEATDTKLNWLTCENNDLTALDISGQPLVLFDCTRNYLDIETIRNAAEGIEYCDFEAQKIPDDAVFSENDIQILNHVLIDPEAWDLNGDPKTWYGVTWENIDGIYYVTELDISGCSYSGTLDVSGLTHLERLSCENNEITELKAENCTSLTFINCESNNISSINASGTPENILVRCEDNYLNEDSLTGISTDVLDDTLQRIDKPADSFDSDEVWELSSAADDYDYDTDKPGEWPFVEWIEIDGLYHARKIDLTGSEYVFRLDLSGFEYLESFICTNSLLKIVTLPDQMTSIDEYSFDNCRDLRTVDLPANIREISDGAFRDCVSLTELTIPKTITHIGADAFSGCSNLQDVYYDGDVSNWNKIEIESGNECLLNANIYYGSTETVSVESVSFEKEALTIHLEETAELHYIILPENSTNKKVTFETSDPDVVTVDANGRMKGVSVGTAIITITTVDGSKTAQCTVTVTDEPVQEEGIYIKNLEPAYTYTGTAIKPEIEVYDTGILLKPKTDYTITYKNTTNAYTFQGTDQDHPTANDKKKAPQIIIKSNSKGNYKGSRTVYFSIEPVSIETDEQLYIENEITLKETTKVQRPVPVITFNGKTVSSKEYTLTYLDSEGNVLDKKTGPKTAGMYMIRIEGNNKNFTGTKEIKLTVSEETNKQKAVALSKAVTVTTEAAEYDGDPKETAIFTNKAGYELIQGTDYTAVYTKNVNAGTATVTATGKGIYTGTVKKTFKITPRLYEEHKNEFRFDVSDAVYSKGGAIPEVHVFWNDNELKTGTDYTLKYTNNKKVTDESVSRWPTVTITFKGNFKGAVTKDFFIDPKPLDQITITSKDKVYSAKANAWKSAPVLKDTDGKTLKAGTDYEKTITYTTVDGDELPAVVEADTLVKVTVTGKGNYTGTAETFYRILETGKDISKLTFKIANKEYTGSPVTLNDNDILSIKSGKNELDLKLGTDYEIVRYTNNVKKGTAKVTFRGKGDYGGEKTVSFKIGQRSFVEYWQGVKNFFSGLF